MGHPCNQPLNKCSPWGGAVNTGGSDSASRPPETPSVAVWAFSLLSSQLTFLLTCDDSVQNVLRVFSF